MSFGHILLLDINVAICILLFMDVDHPCFIIDQIFSINKHTMYLGLWAFGGGEFENSTGLSNYQYKQKEKST